MEDFCRAILAAYRKGGSGEVYNFGGAAERTNLQVVRGIVSALDADPGFITFAADRPGHDPRYAMDFSKAQRELAWRPAKAFEEELANTVAWYRANPLWWPNESQP